jgi:nucleotide-binding universal stress UspA family protein
MRDSNDAFPQRILLATDGSEDAGLAARAAVDLASAAGAELHVVHVWWAVPPYAHPSIALATDPEPYEREARELLFDELDRISELGGEVSRTHLLRGRPADAILSVAQESGAELVVVGSRGLGSIRRLLLGSVSEGVVNYSPSPVLVVRGGEGAWPPRRIVVGDDSSEEACAAAELAARIGGILRAEMTLVQAHPLQKLARLAKLPSERSAIEEVLKRSEEELRRRASELEGVLGRALRVSAVLGEPNAVVLEAAAKDGVPTLVAVGRRGWGRVKRTVLGSVSTAVVRAAKGPVLICPGWGRAQTAEAEDL